MNRLLLILSVIFVCFGAFAAQEELLSQLDDAILHKGKVIKAKEAKISVLKKRLSTTLSNKQDLQTLDDLYNEYHVFKFDSALVYAERGLTLPVHCRTIITHACSHATRLRFSPSVVCLLRQKNV